MANNRKPQISLIAQIKKQDAEGAEKNRFLPLYPPP